MKMQSWSYTSLLICAFMCLVNIQILNIAQFIFINLVFALQSFRVCPQILIPVHEHRNVTTVLCESWALWGSFLPWQCNFLKLSHCFCTRVHSVGVQPARLLCSWDFPSKNPGVGCHFLLQEIFQTRDQTWVSCISKRILYCWATWKAPLVLTKD